MKRFETKTTATDMIPKIIHQTWKTKKIPQGFKPYVSSWKRYNPEWEYRLWTDRDNRNFIKTEYPWFLKRYDAYEENIQRADVVRYFLLYHYGGLYVDLDFECLKPFDDIIAGHPCVMGAEPEIHAKMLYGKDMVTCNALLASVPGHRFWNHLFSELKKTKDKKGALESTGPIVLQNAYASYPHQDIKVYPDIRFYPLIDIHAKDFARFNLSKEAEKYYHDMRLYRSYPESSYAVHHWAGTWCHRGVIDFVKILGRRLKNRITR